MTNKTQKAPKYVRLPFSDVVAYLASNIDQMPRGHAYPSSDRTPNFPDQTFVEAVGLFAREILLTHNRKVAKSADPEMVLLTGLGYPIDRMSRDEVEDLILLTDDIIHPIRHLFGAMITSGLGKLLHERLFNVVVEDEDLLIEFTENVLRDRMMEMRRTIESLTPPKLEITTGDELPDLSEMEEYIGRVITLTFREAEGTPVVGEIKNLFEKALKVYGSE